MPNKFKRALFNLPNQLTLSRMFLAPVIIALLYFPSFWTCLCAGFLFIVAAFTDLFDGYLARKGNQITSLGKFLDPLADKVLISSVLIMLVQNGWVEAWIAIVIICRDVMVSGLRAVAADEGVVIAADKYGKAKTVLQILALTPLIWHYGWPIGSNFILPVHDIGIFTLYMALILTVVSGVNYFLSFWRTWKNSSSPGQ
jgi:CDP-diacylglycerol--glycerol-3-phosphate 3-phosphatidyltransferase